MNCIIEERCVNYFYYDSNSSGGIDKEGEDELGGNGEERRLNPISESWDTEFITERKINGKNTTRGLTRSRKGLTRSRRHKKKKKKNLKKNQEKVIEKAQVG